MKPALAFPYADADGTLFHHLQSILPHLKEHFEHAYISSVPSTLEHDEHVRQLQADDFFTVFPVARDLQIGDHFAELYRRTAATADPGQMIHLCYLDRIAFALEGEYQNVFLADIDSLVPANMPVIFQRSQLAWETHPQNYRELEGMVTTVGHNLFDMDVDYAWCHLAVRAGQLREIMPLVKNPDLSMVAEMIFYLQKNIQTRDVDWLAWEDPFILSRDAAELKRERENSLDETNKRLRYVVPMIETLTGYARNGRK